MSDATQAPRPPFAMPGWLTAVLGVVGGGVTVGTILLTVGGWRGTTDSAISTLTRDVGTMETRLVSAMAQLDTRVTEINRASSDRADRQRNEATAQQLEVGELRGRVAQITTRAVEFSDVMRQLARQGAQQEAVAEDVRVLREAMIRFRGELTDLQRGMPPRRQSGAGQGHDASEPIPVAARQPGRLRLVSNPPRRNP